MEKLTTFGPQPELPWKTWRVSFVGSSRAISPEVGLGAGVFVGRRVALGRVVEVGAFCVLVGRAVFVGRGVSVGMGVFVKVEVSVDVFVVVEVDVEVLVKVGVSDEINPPSKGRESPPPIAGTIKTAAAPARIRNIKIIPTNPQGERFLAGWSVPGAAGGTPPMEPTPPDPGG